MCVCCVYVVCMSCVCVCVSNSSCVYVVHVHVRVRVSNSSACSFSSGCGGSFFKQIECICSRADDPAHKTSLHTLIPGYQLHTHTPVRSHTHTLVNAPTYIHKHTHCYYFFCFCLCHKPNVVVTYSLPLCKVYCVSCHLANSCPLYSVFQFSSHTNKKQSHRLSSLHYCVSFGSHSNPR